MTQPILEIDGVSKSFATGDSRFRALADIDLSMAENEIVALIGPSGCGKSTLLRAVAGLEQPDAGRIRIAGQPVIDAHGLLGQVTRVAPLTSEVTLITEKGTIVPIQVARNGIRGLLYGDGNRVELRYLPLNADVKEGDMLVTSGLGGVFPAGLNVARVSLVERDAGRTFATIQSEPLGLVDRGRFALVLPRAERLPQPSPQPAPPPHRPADEKPAGKPAHRNAQSATTAAPTTGKPAPAATATPPAASAAPATPSTPAAAPARATTHP